MLPSDIDTVEIESNSKNKGHKPDLILVKAVTTSGTFPHNTYEHENPTDIVAKFLQKAKHALQLTDVSGWIATVDGLAITPEKTYAENGLSETITIQWGPREGGGGY